jgi:predicted membrane-bound spermidine synthase
LNEPPAQTADPLKSMRPPPLALLVALQATVSAASLVVEIVAGRMLAPYVGMSLYTWTSIIAVVLAGFSAGHWAGGRIAERPDAAALRLTGWSMAGAALTTAAAIFLLRWTAGPVLSSLSAPMLSITLLSAIAFFLPSFFAGVPAPVLARISVDTRRERPGRALGAIFAAGALGAIAGTLLAGFLFISWIGTIGTLTAITATYVLVGAVLFALSRKTAAGNLLPPAAAMVAALAVGAGGLTAENPCTRESHYYCIRVVDISADPQKPVRLMALDHLVHGVSARDVPQIMFTQHAAMMEQLSRTRMGEKPFDAFLIGGGTYSIPRAWALLDHVGVTVAEIDPVVTDTAISDFWFDPQAASVLHTDARRALETDRNRYDVIIGDAFADIAVPAHLITREFFETVAARLTDDGIYLMNVIDFQDRLHALAAIVKTLRTVFPVVEVWTEQAEAEPDGRRVFIVLAGASPTATGRIRGLGPEPYLAGRLPEDWLSNLLEQRKALLLTDDYAPIDRLLGRLD